jgi:hypothetical protein
MLTVRSRPYGAGVFAMLVLLSSSAACSASKSGGGDGSPTSSSIQTARIRASNVLTGAAVAGATVAGSELTGGTTDSSGSLTVTTTSASTFGIDVNGPSFILRNTLVKVPGAEAAVTLIPNTFDLTAFNQMFRTAVVNGANVDGGLQRWTSAPPLRIISNVIQFNSTGPTYTATSEALTPAEIQGITSDLSYGLPLLTGNVFQSFAGVSTQTVAAGEAVTLLTEGRITFARCSGLSAARGSAGYGQWLFRSDDVVTGGMLCIDRDFDLSGSTFALGVRLHELGHALGAEHVTAKDHVLMNPTISVNDVSQWDRDAAKIAFQRTPGNRTPDKDPSTFTTNRLSIHVATVDGCTVRR